MVTLGAPWLSVGCRSTDEDQPRRIRGAAECRSSSGAFAVLSEVDLGALLEGVVRAAGRSEDREQEEDLVA